jgi:hypothetical protein
MSNVCCMAPNLIAYAACVHSSCKFCILESLLGLCAVCLGDICCCVVVAVEQWCPDAEKHQGTQTNACVVAWPLAKVFTAAGYCMPLSNHAHYDASC